MLETLRSDGTEADYKELQDQMERIAPEVSETAWGHKYFSLLYPDKLDDYHNPDYQRFHLVKLLQRPTDGHGRYESAWQYVAIIKLLDMPMSHFTSTLNEMHGTPYYYWRVGTTSGETHQSYWELMRDNNYVSIGWRDLGDLQIYTKNQQSKDDVKKLMTRVYYPDNPQQAGKKANEAFQFAAGISEGDLVIASDGARVLGIGKVKGSYFYQEALGFPHCRPVEWLSLDEWKLPSPEGLLTTVHKMKNVSNFIEIEKHVIGGIPSEDVDVIHYWVEKTLVKNRSDRVSGEFAVGNALFSPQRDEAGRYRLGPFYC